MLEVLLERLTLDTSRTIFRKCYISQYYLSTVWERFRNGLPYDADACILYSCRSSTRTICTPP